MTTDAKQSLLAHIQSVWPVESGAEVTTVLAVSGGPDSVALARLFASARPKHSTFVLAHYNHHLRGDESNQDEAFVRRLGDELGLDVEVGEPKKDGVKKDVRDQGLGSNQGEGLESLARQQRYEFLIDCAKSRGARFVLTAHTQDDQVETVIQRFFRGTGIRGLAGIRPIRELVPGITLVRPLLRCRKGELVSWLDSIKAEYRTDQSNNSNSFTRNRIRHELLPLVNDIFENDVTKQIVGLGENADEVTNVIGPWVEEAFQNRVVVTAEGRVQVDATPSDPCEPQYLIHELFAKVWVTMGWPLQQMNKEKWNALGVLFFSSDDQKINLPGNILFEKKGRQISIWDGSANRIG